ncbi:MAG: CDP-diacylglycerol--serine O-phosphatidyltransferase [Alphaproteobacteria bacterium]|nr:CDP-diacylglycerol--serine O-phosphatidyltransferase [Alphaproteobacteria bacterium]MBT5389514.1 CDP-diacylglycerol--serine O-phosphatidyltransferase [Alphaproteobacteria bacterium]MBT5541008.1 CDP-diacylglycerol--serine O-phosphatidyltransferase [Alphaproteobacteria bacterium]MBT5654923.1 CDP-diacylglycerol--serine O-phosphatidyltransferase [Alphaproteobacteria bacterium]
MKKTVLKGKPLARLKERRLKELAIHRLIPNILTLTALCAGLNGIRFALMDKWEFAVIAIFVAIIFDTMDGRVARYLDASTRFGGELDSLSDFVSFGVAPAIILYLHTLQNFGRIGWGIALLFAICCALRLARFNTLDIEGTEKLPAQFFRGVPVPAGAVLALLPLIMTLEPEVKYWVPSVAMGISTVVGALLMISQIPTFSLKSRRIKQKHVLPLLLLVVFFVGALVTIPWVTLSIMGIVYLITIPFSVRAYKRYYETTTYHSE